MKTAQGLLHERLLEQADATTAVMALAYSGEPPDQQNINVELAELKIAQRFCVPLETVHQCVELFRNTQGAGCGAIIVTLTEAAKLMGDFDFDTRKSK